MNINIEKITVGDFMLHGVLLGAMLDFVWLGFTALAVIMIIIYASHLTYLITK